jgi:putative zinc finger protein
MDCEKFESALMDELYGELDELTSAAAKRHVSGCARCAALLGGLRATRRVAALPRVEPPPYLEQRILDAAAAATPRVVPLRGRLARAVSLAGSWAMRPQTAMAAVFLVMIGTSVLLLRGKSSRAPASAEMTVTEEGTPAPAGPSPAAATVAAAEPAASAAPEPIAVAAHAERAMPASAPPTAMFAAPPADMADDSRSRSPAKAAKGEDGMGAVALNGPSRGSAGAGVAPPAAAPPLPASPPPVAAGGMPGGSYASAPEAEMAPAAQAAPADPSDELWAARTARDAAARQGRPCPSGARFDDVASRAPGSQPGWDALFEGALCYESLGEFGSARTRLGTLLGVPSYRDRARYTLDRINKEQQGGGASAARAAAPKAAPAAPAAPPAAPASPPSSDMH